MSTPEASGRAFVERLAPANSSGYDLTLQPSPVDTTIKQLIDAYKALPPGDRAAFTKPFGVDQSFLLLLFAIRMSMLAVREHSAERIADGLMALVVEHGKLDWREIVIVLSLLNHSAQLISANASALFDGAAAIATPQIAEQLRGFTRRDPGLQHIASFGWRAAGSGQSFRYERI